MNTSTAMAAHKRVALVAHDNKKSELLEWARYNRELLAKHELYATGTTGRLVADALGIQVHRFLSGPMGGDQQVGAKISQGELDCLVFFWDPLESQPHDTDVKALLRIAMVWNIPVACNRASADFLVSSPLMERPYKRLLPYHDRVATGRSRRKNAANQVHAEPSGADGVEAHDAVVVG